VFDALSPVDVMVIFFDLHFCERRKNAPHRCTEALINGSSMMKAILTTKEAPSLR
jgi:hypothetical protein